MSEKTNKSGELLAFRSLHASPIVDVREYVCRACRGGPAGDEHSSSNTVVLMRSGAFCKHFGRRQVTADVNQAVYFSKGSTYRVSHPADCGDRGTIFTVSPRILCDIVRELDPSVDDRPEQPFAFENGPCDSKMFWRHRELVTKLESASIDPLPALWADITSLQLVADLLEASFDRTRKRRRPQKQRIATNADHAERVEAVKTYLAARLRGKISLDEVADAVHVSPFHLSRIFQQRTGLPVHRYLMQLRLRAALEKILGGANDLTMVALEFGFSSHSHMTESFRREFGKPPSQLRRGEVTFPASVQDGKPDPNVRERSK